MRVVVAPDSFKGSIGAAGAAAALAEGWLSARPGDQVTCFPLADGGEGTLEVLAAATGAGRWHRAEVTGPGGRRVDSCWLELPGQTHVIELARASGLPLLAAPDPLRAHTAGVGELIGHALDAGARRMLIALGGSASTDGGSGALTALGARFLDAAGRDLPPGGAALAGLAAADLSGLRPAPPDGVTCLTDVRAPLLGPAGAAAVFGPQKGADARQVEALEAGLGRLAEVLGGRSAAPGAGAAGGTAYGLAAAWGAAIVPGAGELCRIAGFDQALAGTDLVITGEGCYDRTSADGKVAGAVFAAAGQAGVPAALVAGVIASDPPPGVVRSVALASLAGDGGAARGNPERWLRAAGRMLALDLARKADTGA
jgi:glycerate 2-kinase